MSERPILFSGPMVRAILEGRKTQTRRVIKPQPDEDGLAREISVPLPRTYGPWMDTSERIYRSYQERDCLWVRETHLFSTEYDNTPHLIYRADNASHRVQDNAGWLMEKDFNKWRPSIFMPRWASRISLEVTNIRVQRLQEISEDDAKAEGVMPEYAHRMVEAGHPYTAITLYKNLWNLLNQKRGFGWSVNPWVWVIEFKRV